MEHDILSEVAVGEPCVVEAVCMEHIMTRRLADMGIMPGATVKCAHMAPSGTPIAFWVKGALLALRRSDCENIKVRPCET